MSSKLDQALDDAIKDRRKTGRERPSSHSQQRQRQPVSSSRSLSDRLGGGASFDRQRRDGGNIRKPVHSRLGGAGGGSSRFTSGNFGGSQRNTRRGKDFGGKRSTDQPWSHDLFTGSKRESDEPKSIHDRLGRTRSGPPGIGGGRQQNQQRHSTGTVLQVENVHYNVTEQDLQDVFKLVGTVEKCYIEFDRSGRSTGVAKVTFPRQDEAQRALDKFNNVDLDGQPMKISFFNKSASTSHRSNGREPSSGSRQTRSSRNESDLDAELEAYTKGSSNNNNARDDDGDAMMLD